jgi:hypothetical protein
MGSMTIRQIDDDMKEWLRRRAAETGRSVEGEVRHILARERDRDDPENYPPGMAPRPDERIGSYLYRISRPGFELDPPERKIEPMRDPFDDLG